MKFEKVRLSVLVEVPDHVFEQKSPFSPHLLAKEITGHVERYIADESLGYYPALDFCREVSAIPDALLEALDQLSWLASSAARSELLLKLRPLYASVQVKSMQVIAYNMPQVRLKQATECNEIIRHYTANRVKVDLLITLVNQAGNKELLAEYVKKSTWRNLEDVFESLEIGAAILV